MSRLFDRLGDALPDSRKSREKRRFSLLDRVIECLVTRREEEGDLVDAELRICVKNEVDEELAGGEYRVVEGCSSCVRSFPAVTPDSCGVVGCLKTLLTAVRTGASGPDRLESPLDGGVERLRPKLYCTSFEPVIETIS